MVNGLLCTFSHFGKINLHKHYQVMVFQVSKIPELAFILNGCNTGLHLRKNHAGLFIIQASFFTKLHC